MPKLTIKKRGSTSIEAAIVASLMIVLILCVIYAFLLMYQMILVQYTASAAARGAAFVWSDVSLDPLTGAESDRYGENSRYWELGYLFGSSEESYTLNGDITDSSDISHGDDRLRKAAEISKLHLLNGVLDTQESQVEVVYSSSLTFPTLSVTVSQAVELPVLSFASFLGGDGTLTISATASSGVQDASTYITGVDSAVEGALLIIDRLSSLAPTIFSIFTAFTSS